MKLNDKLAVAKAFSTMLFEDKGARYGEFPYSRHLQDVVDTLLYYNVTDRDVLAAGYLHDILEDTGVSKSLIEEMFGTECADLVWRVTDEPGVNRKERKAATYPKILADHRALQIKLADRIANVGFSIITRNERMFRMYMKEHPEFSANLRTHSHFEMWQRLDAQIHNGLAKIHE